MRRRRLNPRKLLIATAGVATINYTALTGCDNVPTNKVSTPATDDGPPTVANLVAPPPRMPDSGALDSGAPRPDAAVDAGASEVGTNAQARNEAG